MKTVTVALLQLAAQGLDVSASLAHGEAFCRQAAALGADIALFPEMWNTGYTYGVESPVVRIPDQTTPPVGALDVWRSPDQWTTGARVQDPEVEAALGAWQAQAVDSDSPFVNHFRSLARELNMAIALTYLERWPAAPRNTLSLIDRRGQIVLTYAKVHTCDFFLPEARCTPGDDFFVAELDTAAGPVSIGAMICMDREFPEAARVLMLRGAEILLVPNACDLEINRISQLRSRAYENMVAVALANYAAPGLGHSIAFDGVAFDANGRSRDMLAVEAGEAEGIYLANFDLEALRDYRQREIWGDAFRRPHRYGALVEDSVQEPFVRVNAGGERYPRTRR